MAQLIERYPVLFPAYFLGLWLALTTLQGVMSGWCGLMQRYPDRVEAALATLKRQLRMIGLWIGLSWILNLGVCPSGLRVSILRIFGPFPRPFFVPWGEISAARASAAVFGPMIKLTFERADLGALWLYPRTWERRRAGVMNARLASQSPPPFTDKELLKGLALQWVIDTPWPPPSSMSRLG